MVIIYWLLYRTIVVPSSRLSLKMRREEGGHVGISSLRLVVGERWDEDVRAGIGSLAYIQTMCVHNNIILQRVHRSWLLPVRDEREYESDQGHAATEYDDQGEHALLARHRPSVARQVAHDGHPSRVNALHFGNPPKIRVYVETFIVTVVIF